MIRFSVCMSVYKGDCSSNFEISLNSIMNQTLIPNEVILVVDGPISTEINNIIQDFEQRFAQFRIIRLNKNQGHAKARQTALMAAKNDFIAIMDSDDVSEPTRFEKQISVFEKFTDVDVVGGQIEEFIDKMDNKVGKRIVPLSDRDIKKYAKSRCPMNLVTVMMKKRKVQEAGGYIDWFCEEDYYLWLRMVQRNCSFLNLPDTLVYVRVGKDMYHRRGGWKYFKSEAKLQIYMSKTHFIMLPTCLINILIRFTVQILMPNCVRSFVFQKLLRKQI